MMNATGAPEGILVEFVVTGIAIGAPEFDVPGTDEFFWYSRDGDTRAGVMGVLPGAPLTEFTAAAEHLTRFVRATWPATARVTRWNEDLTTVDEIAIWTNMSRATVDAWTTQPGFPTPWTHVGVGPARSAVWATSDVHAWIWNHRHDTCSDARQHGPALYPTPSEVAAMNLTITRVNSELDDLAEPQPSP